VVKATGFYYEERAYFPADNQQLLRILSPNKLKYFARSTALKNKTDQLDGTLSYLTFQLLAQPQLHFEK
jgi:hypothetical protein